MLRISRSVLAAARGSIGERDDMIPSQESARGREAIVKAVQREQQLHNEEGSVLCRPRKCSAEVAGGHQGLRRPKYDNAGTT